MEYVINDSDKQNINSKNAFFVFNQTIDSYKDHPEIVSLLY